MRDTYRTIAVAGESEFRDRGSKFFGFAQGVTTEAEALEMVEVLRKRHPKANHHCYAYRLGLGTDLYRANDDGEPSGTAGRPILGRIDQLSLTDTCVVVVRYFGGTLLGTGGLINAYRTAAELALGQAEVGERIVQEVITLSFGYEQMSTVMNAISRMGLSMQAQRFQEAAEIDVAIRRSEVRETLQQLKAYLADVYLEEVDDDFELEAIQIRRGETTA